MLAFCDRNVYRTFDGWITNESLILPTRYANNCVTWVKKSAIEAKFSLGSNFSTVYVCVDGYEYGDPNNPDKCLPEFWKMINVFSLNFDSTYWTKLDDSTIFDTNNYAQRYSIDETIQDPYYIYLGGNFLDSTGLQYKLYSFNKNTNDIAKIFSHEAGGGYMSKFGGINRNMNQLIMSDSKQNEFYACGFYMTQADYSTNSVIVFEDQGYPWTFYHVDTRDVDYILDENNNEYLFIGNDGGVTKGFRSSTASQPEFSNINGTGLFITQFYGIGLSNQHPSYYGGGSQDNGFFYYYPPNKWNNKTSGIGDAYDVCIHQSNQNIAYIVCGSGSGQGAVMKTINGFGITSNALDTNVPSPNEGCLVNRPMVFNPVDYDEIFLGYQNIYKATVDANQNPPVVNNFSQPPFFDFSQHAIWYTDVLAAIAIAPSNENIIYIAYAGKFPWDNSIPGWKETPKLFKTIDKGQNWTDLTDNLNYESSNNEDWALYKCGITSIAIAPDNPNNIWISFGNFASGLNGTQYRVLYSTNGGSSFQDLYSSSLPNLPVNSAKAIGSNGNYSIFIGTDAGVFRYNDTEHEWEPFNKHLPPAIVTDIDYVEPNNLDNCPEALRISTFGYGIWESQLDCSIYGEPETISTTVEWNTDRTMHNNVFIEYGGYLTITSIVKFVEGAGIYASGVSAAQITRSDFTILKIDTNSREHFGGLYLDFCNGYRVEDNVFTGPGGNDNSWAIGAIINNSNCGSYIDADNEIYNNNFDSLNIGILAQNKNRSNDGSQGLTLKCNYFNTCRYDIAVTVYNPSIMGLGIKDPQGRSGSDVTYPAGNIFSVRNPFSPPSHTDYNYHNEGGMLMYYHHDTVNAPFPVKVRPTNYSTINPQRSAIGNFYDSLTCCLSNFTPGGGGGGIEDQKLLLGEYEADADSVKNLLTLLVDGGNTQQTNLDVISSTPEKALEVYNDLISKSPYLSDTVMVSAINQESVLNAAMVTDILTENPQSAKSDTVLQELENRINPLSDDQITDIMQGLYITGAKEALESNLAGYYNDYSRTLNNIIRYHSFDTLSASPVDSVLTWLTCSDYLWARYQQAFILNENGDSAGATSLLENLPDSYPFTPEMTMEHQNYQDLINLYKQCQDSLFSVLQSDSSQVNALVSIAQDSSGLTSIYATNLLVALHATTYIEPYLLPVSGLKESTVVWPGKTIRERNFMKIYPNPAATYCVFEIELKDYQAGSTLEIADIQGRKITSLILAKNHDYLIFPLDNLPSGLYICTIRSGGKAVKCAKLIVSK